MNFIRSILSLQQWLKQNVPGLCNEGLDLLSKLLELNPDKRISAKDALRHPYLNVEKRTFSFNENNKDKIGLAINHNYNIAKALMELETHKTKLSKSSTILLPNQEGAINKLDKNYIKIDHWAKLVDWMIEIVDVFEKHPRTAFLAMDYFHKFVSNVKVRIISCKSICLVR